MSFAQLLTLLSQLALPVFAKCVTIFFQAGGGAAGKAAVIAYIESLFTGTTPAVTHPETVTHMKDVVAQLNNASNVTP